MKKIFKIFVVLFLFFFFFKSYSASFAAPSIGTITVQPPGTTVQQYTKFEIGFPITTIATNRLYVYENSPLPGLERDASGHGTGITVDMLILPNNQSNWANAKTQACFWFQPYEELGDYLLPKGKAEWRCRVGPDTVGNFKYKIRATDASGTSETAENIFNVVPNTSNNPTKKGYVKVSTRDNRFFEYSDGSAFFTPLMNVEVNNFNSLVGIRSNISDLGQNAVRFVRWFPTRETGRLYFFGGDISDAWPGSCDHDCNSTMIDDVDTSRGKKFSIMPAAIYMTQTFSAVPGARYRLTLRAHVVSPGLFRATVSFSGSASQTFEIPADSTCTQANTCFKSYTSQEFINSDNADAVSVTLNRVGGGSVRISDVVFQRLENQPGEIGEWGANLLHHSDGDTYSYVDQVQAAKMDELMKQSEELGVYHKMPLFWKEDYVLAYITDDCQASENRVGWLNFELPTCSVWYQKNYARYFMARWSYSTAIHSLEYANEHDPGWWQSGVALASFVRPLTYRKVLMSNSYYHLGADMSALDPSVWNDPVIDYVDRHYYAVQQPNPTPTPPNPDMDGPNSIYSDQIFDGTAYSRACFIAFRNYNMQNSINKPYVQGEGGAMISGYGEDSRPSDDSYNNWYHKKLWVNVGALGSTCDGEWWPHLWNSPLFPIYSAYFAFLEGEPLSNGTHVEIGTDNMVYGTTSCSSGNNCIDDTATTPNTNLRAYGSKDPVTRRVLVWVDNKNNTWNLNPGGAPAQSATYNIFGMPNKSNPGYTMEVWDTRTGTHTTTFDAVDVTNGILQFSASGITTDKAYKFYDPNAPTPTSGSAASPTPVCGAPGDIDCSQEVNSLDLAMLIFLYGQDVPGGTREDIDNSGKVNSLDLTILLSNFGK